MEAKSMTALVSAFSRAYHARNNETKIFDDCVAERLFTEEEYDRISKHMADGIGFFNPSFVGGPEEGLRWIVDHQLSPAPLGRAAFAEKSLERAVNIGAKQYLILGAGYDTFAYRLPAWANTLEIFEIDRPAAAMDKRKRLKRAQIAIPPQVHYIDADLTKKAWQAALRNHEAFDAAKISCAAILGVTYYLSRPALAALLAVLGGLVPNGSSILLDYPDETSNTQRAGERAKKQAMLADAANEKMQAGYSYSDMERLLSAHGFLIYEHLTPQDMTGQYFSAYNLAKPSHAMTAFDHVNYCLAVKK